MSDKKCPHSVGANQKCDRPACQNSSADRFQYLYSYCNSDTYNANIEDLDPENNYYNDLSLPDSVYLTADRLRKSIEGNTSNFSIIHVNCCSLKTNFDSLTLLLGKLCFPVSAIYVSETWTVPDSEQDYCIPGYTFFTVNPDLKKFVVMLVYMHQKVLTV